MEVVRCSHPHNARSFITTSQMSVPETHKADWNQEQPAAQIKETNPITRLAMNQEVKL